MGKVIAQFTGIILINLFAFLSVGYILDEIFESGNKIKMVMLILSVLSLAFVSNIYFKNALGTFKKISPKKDKDTNNKHTK